jgi:hypothetical protein
MVEMRADSRDPTVSAPEPMAELNQPPIVYRVPTTVGTPTRRRPKRHHKRQLLTRDDLDLRTTAGKAFLQLITSITADLGGVDQLSTMEKALIEGFAGATVALTDLNTKLLRDGEAKVNVLTAHAAAINSLSKLAARLGTERRARIVPSLDEFLEMRRAHGNNPRVEILE